jgi:DUF1365 family protein
MSGSVDGGARGPAAQLLLGQVLHERLRPLRRRFVYPVFQLRLDLDRLDELDGPWFGVDRPRLLSLHRRDYGPRDGSALAPWLRQRLREAGLPDDGPIWLQTFPRIFGWVFNPVSFWYCHDRAGRLRALLAEVNNTFGEHHAYLLAPADGAPIGPGVRLHCRKALHVSPFCRVEGRYEFRCREAPGASRVAIDYHDARGLLLRTAVGGRLLPLAAGPLLRAWRAHPLQPFGVFGRIHWQALRLWLARVPWVAKPPPPSHDLTLAEREETVP